MSGLPFSVRELEVLPPYTLKLRFEDGSVKTYDMTSHLNSFPWYPLRDKELFKSARVFAGSVVWSDTIDIAPEELYENGIPCE
jgi:hypothetical protein